MHPGINVVCFSFLERKPGPAQLCLWTIPGNESVCLQRNGRTQGKVKISLKIKFKKF